MARKQIPSGLKGSGCLSVPFFTGDDKINVTEMKRHVEWLIKEGTRTIVPGSVCPGCTREETRLVWKATKDAAEGKATVMPYLGPRCNTTALFLEDIKAAEDIGCDALYFSVQTTTNATGYYENPAFLDQLVEPWRAGLEATGLPVMIYNHSGLPYSREPNLPVDILVEISREYESVAGIKTNSPLAGQLAAEIRALKPLGLSIAKGLHEMEFIGSLAMGVDGFISITGHALPDLCNTVYESFLAGDINKAQDVLWQMFPILDVVGSEASAKVEYYPWKMYLLEARGFNVGKPRPPMRSLPEDAKRAIDNTYKELGIYKECA